MRGLGVSIYPSETSFEKDEKYLRKAASLGFTRVFTCFLSINLIGKELVEFIKKYSSLMHDLGMILSVDTNPEVFQKLNIDIKNPILFKEMGVDIVRLDAAFDIETTMDFIDNDLGLIVELNASSMLDIDRLKNVKKKEQLLTCHNFYPQRYTGLDLDIFNKFTNNITRENIKVAAFISSKEKNTFGPWPVYDGLPTLEYCRDLSIDEQFRYLTSLNCIDDIFIGNAYASDEELETMALLNKEEFTCIRLKDVYCCDDIVYNNIHRYRQDGNSIIIRSSATKGKSVKFISDDKKLYPKDVVLVNENLKYYEGEVQIILKEIDNDATRSVIGRLSDVEFSIAKNLKQKDYFKIIK